MPRNPNQLSLPPPRSPAMNNSSAMSGFNTYTGQLAVSVQEAANGQWEEGWLVPLSNLHHKCAILSIPYAFLLTCVFFINYPNTLYHFICPFYTLFLVSLSFMIHLFSSPFYRAHALIQLFCFVLLLISYKFPLFHLFIHMFFLLPLSSNISSLLIIHFLFDCFIIPHLFPLSHLFFLACLLPWQFPGFMHLSLFSIPYVSYFSSSLYTTCLVWLFFLTKYICRHALNADILILPADMILFVTSTTLYMPIHCTTFHTCASVSVPCFR